jgi:PAS domain S-box-containing protein
MTQKKGDSSTELDESVNQDEAREAVAALRERAERIAQARGVKAPENLETLSPDQALKLIHELSVHRIELQMQNDELRETHAQLDAVRARYFDLYNLAPVGYFVVSHDGRILEANLTGVNLLGTFRAALVKQPITRFIFAEDQDIYYLHRTELLATGKAHTCELRMVKADGTTFRARLTATTTRPPSTGPDFGSGGAPVIRVVLSDISEPEPMARDEAGLAKKPRAAMPWRGKGGKQPH